MRISDWSSDVCSSDLEAAGNHLHGGRELADLRAHAHGDAAAADQGGGESEADAELLEDDGDGVLVLRHRDGELTASEDAGCLAGDSSQVGFRKDGDQVVLGQGIAPRINRGVADVPAVTDVDDTVAPIVRAT